MRGFLTNIAHGKTTGRGALKKPSAGALLKVVFKFFAATRVSQFA